MLTKMMNKTITTPTAIKNHGEVSTLSTPWVKNRIGLALTSSFETRLMVSKGSPL